MKVRFDCFDCIFHQLKLLAVQAGQNDDDRIRIMRRMLGALCERLGDVTPPQLAERFFGIAAEETGIADPFAREKAKSTEIALAMLPELRRLAAAAPDPFAATVLYAIGGNIIDYGVHPDFDIRRAEQAILEVAEMEYDREAMAELHRRLDRAGRVLYILDNCGEAVIDRLVIEPDREKITIGVRGRAIMNDITRAEVAPSGLDFVPVVDTGRAIAGVSLSECSPEFRRVIDNVDLVVAKGQGNFESLEADYRRPVFFLFRAKCRTICSYLGGTEINSLQIIGRNL